MEQETSGVWTAVLIFESGVFYQVRECRPGIWIKSQVEEGARHFLLNSAEVTAPMKPFGDWGQMGQEGKGKERHEVLKEAVVLF